MAKLDSTPVEMSLSPVQVKRILQDHLEKQFPGVIVTSADVDLNVKGSRLHGYSYSYEGITVKLLMTGVEA